VSDYGKLGVPIAHFDNLSDIGVVKDTSEFDIPENAFTDARNVRFTDGAVRKAKGREQVFGTLLGTPYFAMPVTKSGSKFWFYADQEYIYGTDNTNHYKMSSATAAMSLDINWTGGVLGNSIVIMNESTTDPYVWSGSALTDAFGSLANWPASMTCRSLRVHKQRLIAMDIDEGSGRDDTLLRWSHPAVPGGVPASWDYADKTKSSGRVTIDGPGAIIDGLPLRDQFIVYKEQSVHSMQLIGGNATYQIRKMFDEFGLLSRRCVQEFYGKHFCVTQGDILIHDGHDHQPVFDRRMLDWLFSNIDSGNYERSFVSINYNEREVWICFPESGQTLPNLALVWNWQDNTTQIQELPVGTAHIGWGIVDPNIDTTIDGRTGTIDSYTDAIDSSYYTQVKRSNLICNTTLDRLQRLYYTDQFDGANMTAYVQRSALPLGRETQTGKKFDPHRIKFISEIWPVIEGTTGGIVNVYVGARDTPDATVSWSGPYQHTIGSTTKLPMRVSGRLIDIKFESTTDIDWELVKYSVVYELGGER